MIFSPIFGFLADKCGSIRTVCLLCCLVFTAGNVLYATISLSQFLPSFAELLIFRGREKNCIAHHFWCIVLAFFKAPSFRYAKSHLSLLMHSITLQQQYAFAASAAAAHWNILGSILHMPKLVSFHLLRNWCIIGSAVLLLYASRLYPLWRQFPYSISAILRSAALYMLFTWVPTWKKLSFYLSNICPTKSLLSLFVASTATAYPPLYAYFLQGIFLHQRTFSAAQTALLVYLMVCICNWYIYAHA